MSEHVYVIDTEHGEVRVVAENIGAARAIAKKRFKVKHPQCTRRERVYVRFSACFEFWPCFAQSVFVASGGSKMPVSPFFMVSL